MKQACLRYRRAKVKKFSQILTLKLFSCAALLLRHADCSPIKIFFVVFSPKETTEKSCKFLAYPILFQLCRPFLLEGLQKMRYLDVVNDMIVQQKQRPGTTERLTFWWGKAHS